MLGCICGGLLESFIILCSGIIMIVTHFYLKIRGL